MAAKLRVLVAEGSTDDAERAIACLRGSGIDCITCCVADKTALVRALVEFTPDVIVSDSLLPGISGLEALDIAKGVRPDTPFIFVSGSIGEEQAVALLKYGATDFVLKSNLQRLPVVVNRALERARECTASAQVEHALQARDEKFRLITENVSDLISMVDTEGMRVYMNPAYRTLLGHSPSSAIGPDSFQDIHPEDRDKVRQIFTYTVATGAGRCAEFRLLLSDGRTRHIESKSDVIRDRTGNVANVVIVSRDVTERRHAEDQIVAALREKETLLKEVYHRVKNNLQIVSSLLSLQSSGLPDGTARVLLQDCADRVVAMALAHETLYQSDNLSQVDLPQYVGSLLAYLLHAHGGEAREISVKTEVAKVELGIEITIPLALILSELVTNCLKHAFQDRRGGTVLVRLQPAGENMLALSVADDGIGLPRNVALQQTRSLGLSLVRTLAAQIKGRVSSDAARGTQFVVTFPTRERMPATHDGSRQPALV
jgi:PAS domain S-box-containing protein